MDQGDSLSGQHLKTHDIRPRRTGAQAWLQSQLRLDNPVENAYSDTRFLDISEQSMYTSHSPRNIISQTPYLFSKQNALD
jgi:hypothetical protein